MTSTGLSEQLRTATRPQHEHAETRSFVTDLMDGSLDVPAYTTLARQHHAIYAALEEEGRRLAEDPAAAPFVRPELWREDALAHDLTSLAGPGWWQVEVLPATARYVARLEAIDSPAAYLAHAYTRYLGDLSGGQIIARMLQRHYAMPAHQLTFYSFTEIPKPKPYKDAWRAAMDAAPFSADEVAACVAEAQVAFDLNAALFVELGDRYPARTDVPAAVSA